MNYDDDNDDFETCPYCGGGWAYELGNLGKSRWFRCRDCGSDFSLSPVTQDESPATVQPRSERPISTTNNNLP